MTTRWQLAHLLGYLRSWSAVATFREREGRDIVNEYASALASAWGDPDTPRPVRFPLTIVAGRL
jgi:hypothetical protein